MTCTRMMLTHAFLLIVTWAYAEGVYSGCVEEVFNPPPPAPSTRTVYTTNDTWIWYDGVLYGDELNILPADSTYKWVDQGETFLDVVPTDGNASYAGKTLTEISFTVEGVDKVTVFLVIRKDDTLTVPFLRKFNMQKPGRQERVVVDVDQRQSLFIVVNLFRHNQEIMKLYDMKLTVCNE